MKSKVFAAIGVLGLAVLAGIPTFAAPPEEEKKEEKKWDVENPPYPMPVVAKIDTDEGTWMSLDVSPDGGEIPAPRRISCSST